MKTFLWVVEAEADGAKRRIVVRAAKASSAARFGARDLTWPPTKISVRRLSEKDPEWTEEDRAPPPPAELSAAELGVPDWCVAKGRHPPQWLIRPEDVWSHEDESASNVYFQDKDSARTEMLAAGWSELPSAKGLVPNFRRASDGALASICCGPDGWECMFRAEDGSILRIDRKISSLYKKPDGA